MRIRPVIVIALLLMATPAASKLDFELTKIAPGVIVFTSQEPGIGNAVAIITDRDVLVVDS